MDGLTELPVLETKPGPRRRLASWSALTLAALLVLAGTTIWIHRGAPGQFALALLGLASLVLSLRWLDRGLALPLSAEAKVVGLAVASPWIFADLAARLWPGRHLVALAVLFAGLSILRRGLAALGGALLGLAAMVTPALAPVGLWLLLRRRIGAGLAMALVLILGLGALSYARGSFETVDCWLSEVSSSGPRSEDSAVDTYRAGLLVRALGSEVGFRPDRGRSFDVFVAPLVFALALVLSWRRQRGRVALPPADLALALAAGLLAFPGGTPERLALILPCAALGWAAWRHAPGSHDGSEKRRRLLSAAVFILAAFASVSSWMASIPTTAVAAVLPLAALASARHLYPSTRLTPEGQPPCGD